MGSLVGRVSATAGAFLKEHPKEAEKSRDCQPPALSLLKPALAAPLLTWTLQTRISFRHLVAAGLQSPPTSLWRIGLADGDTGGEYAAQSCNPLHSFCFGRRRSSRDSGIVLTGAGGDGVCDRATAILEEAAAIEDSKEQRQKHLWLLGARFSHGECSH